MENWFIIHSYIADQILWHSLGNSSLDFPYSRSDDRLIVPDIIYAIMLIYVAQVHATMYYADGRIICVIMVNIIAGMLFLGILISGAAENIWLIKAYLLINIIAANSPLWELLL